MSDDALLLAEPLAAAVAARDAVALARSAHLLPRPLHDAPPQLLQQLQLHDTEWLHRIWQTIPAGDPLEDLREVVMVQDLLPDEMLPLALADASASLRLAAIDLWGWNIVDGQLVAPRGSLDVWAREFSPQAIPVPVWELRTLLCQGPIPPELTEMLIGAVEARHARIIPDLWPIPATSPTSETLVAGWLDLLREGSLTANPGLTSTQRQRLLALPWLDEDHLFDLVQGALSARDLPTLKLALLASPARMTDTFQRLGTWRRWLELEEVPAGLVPVLVADLCAVDSWGGLADSLVRLLPSQHLRVEDQAQLLSHPSPLVREHVARHLASHQPSPPRSLRRP